MKQPHNLLFIEDETDIAHLVRDYLNVNGFNVRIASTATEGWELLQQGEIDLIILDINLPDQDGIDLCRQIREISKLPILILSARGNDTDKVLGLGFGADDYMTKPFSLIELVARVQALLRRVGEWATPHQEQAQPDHLIRLGQITIDAKAYVVKVADQEIALSAKEFELLHFLVSHPNQVFSKRQLLDEIWGYDTYGDENTITVYIRRLREKLESDPSNPSLIKTVWGIGYKCDVHA